MPEYASDMPTLLAKITALPTPRVIAISGFGGAGKSTLAAQLQCNLPASEVVSIDDFQTPEQMTRSSDWKGFPRTPIKDIIQKVRAGQEVSYPRHNPTKIAPPPVHAFSGAATQTLILEGVGLLHPDSLPTYDLTVWLDVDLPTASTQGIRRDRDEYHVPHTELWQEVWTPNDQDFFDTYHPDKVANIIYQP